MSRASHARTPPSASANAPSMATAAIHARGRPVRARNPANSSTYTSRSTHAENANRSIAFSGA